MTSLSTAFDAAPMDEKGAAQRDAPYSNPQVPRYEDNTLDEADKRYAYERSRQKLYAKSPPHHNGQRPARYNANHFRFWIIGAREI